MKIQFIGATHEVTGSCTLLEVCGKKYLVDCGMEQGIDVFENVPIPVPANTIEAVFLTHAHIDHSGMLPKLYKDILIGGAKVILRDLFDGDPADIVVLQFLRSAVCDGSMEQREPYGKIGVFMDEFHIDITHRHSNIQLLLALANQSGFFALTRLHLTADEFP